MAFLIKKDHDNPEEVYFTCIKEKFGLLRVYMSEENDPIEEAITQAEEESGTICELCGKPGEHREVFGWESTRCVAYHEQSMEKMPKNKTDDEGRPYDWYSNPPKVCDD